MVKLLFVLFFLVNGGLLVIFSKDANTRLDEYTKINGSTFANIYSQLQLSANPSFKTVQTAPSQRLNSGSDDEVLIDSFLPASSLPDTADKTIYIQKALNAAANKKLVFNPKYKYACRTVYLSDGTTVDFNGAVIQPYWAISQSEGVLFWFNGNKIGFDGKYSSTSVNGTSQNKKTLKGVKLVNGVFQMKNYNIDAIQGMSVYSKWTSIDNFIIENCISYNCSGRSFSMLNSSYVNDSTPVVKNVQFTNVKAYYNGQNIALYVTAPGKIGDTSVYISTADKMNILNRVGIGQYIKFGSADINPNIQLSGYGTTNKIYQIKRFTPDAADSTKGRIDITGGSYDKASGFVDSAMGLTAKVWANTIFLPVDGWSYSTLLGRPNFDGVAGNTTISRSAINLQQDAYMKNLYPGMEICIFGEPGNYTILSKTNTTLTLDKPLLSTFKGKFVKVNGVQNDAVAFMGFIQNAKLDQSYLYANNHGLFLTGSAGRGLFQEDINTNLTVTGTSFWYSWMNVESPPGTVTLSSIDNSGFNKTVNKGDTSFKVSKALYRKDEKDINNGGVADIALTTLKTTNADITFKNSIFVGDIFGSPRFHYRYQLTSITDEADSVLLGFQRWDSYAKKNVPGGFDIGTNLNGRQMTFDRLYSIYSGEVDVIKNQTYTGNNFNYSWRENGGGYSISVKGYNVNIQNNEFTTAGSAVFEISGYKCAIRNNKIISYLFDGSKIQPAVWTERKYASAGVSAGGWGTSASAVVDIEGNDVNYINPPAASQNDYSWYTGGMNVTYSGSSLHSAEHFNFSNNIVNGLRGHLIGTVENESVTNTSSTYSAPIFYFEEVIISGNRISLAQDYMNGGLFSPLLSTKMSIIKNSIIATSPMNGNIVEFDNVGLNPKLFDTTATYKTLIISDNKYPVGTTPKLNLRLSKERIFYDDDKLKKRDD